MLKHTLLKKMKESNMVYEKYAERKMRKIQNSLDLYSRYLFNCIERFDSVPSLETSDHLRYPPDREQMKNIACGETWGREYSNLWLEFDIKIPQIAAGSIICLIPDTGAVETLCFKNGKPNGIINSTNKFIGGNHSFMFVSSDAQENEVYHISLECYAGHTKLGTRPLQNFDVDESHVDQESFKHVFKGVQICTLDTAVRDCIFDMSVALQLAQLPEDNYTSQKAYRCIERAYPYFIQDPTDALRSEIHTSALRVSEELEPVLRKTHGEGSRGSVTLVGHSHMDTAWTWPITETIRKCARTYSQVITLMDMYPDYTFVQSSALHLDWMKQYYPTIYESIKEKIIEGRYEPNGAVWVECDCNVSGGEAMARQFIYGQRFTMEQFGYVSDCFWLPDTFGYNASIPQIMKHSRVKYFCTTKLEWNDLNRCPYGTFIWKGLDGTEVLCHLNSMNTIPDPKTVYQTYTHVTNRRTESMRLAAYGFGDGGGGPTYGMLEYIKRITDLEGMPLIKQSKVSDFMQELEKNSSQFPVYDGELYFEMHRGTLTKMHEVKKLNRFAEIALHDLEFALCVNKNYRCTKLDDYWKLLLKNQFHDILPGTCIPKVYDIELPEMRELLDTVNQETNSCLKTIAEQNRHAFTLVNTLSFDRNDVFTIEGSYSLKGIVSQTYQDIDGVIKTAFHASIPAMGSTVVYTTNDKPGKSVFEIDGHHIVTPFYDIVIDGNGYIEELKDIATSRSLVKDNGYHLGTLFCGEAVPEVGDNWDIDDDCFDKLIPIKASGAPQIVADGPVELRIRNKYHLGYKSSCIVDTIMYGESKRIDYEMRLEWHERHQLLKVGFNLNLRSRFLKSEIQFGNVDRPTTRNNSFEAAQFEVCNHKWSDMSETRYGVAVLNDCKYGISALDSDMRLTLMAPGCRPDPVTDNGIHYMRYAILPHIGPFDANNVTQPAYSYNYHPICLKGLVVTLIPLFQIDVSNVICEAVKPAYNHRDAYVLRLYECEGNHTIANLNLDNAKRVYITNFLEEIAGELQICEEGKVNLRFNPFEIKTLLVMS